MAKGEPRLINGIWFFPDGTRITQVAGGQDPPDGGTGGEGKPTGDPDGGGQGDPDPGTDPDPTDSTKDWSPEAKAAVKSANAEAAKRKRELRETQQRLDALQAQMDQTTGATKSEITKALEAKQAAEDRAAKAEEGLKTMKVKSHIHAEAAKMGFRNPTAAFKLLDADDLVFDDGDDLPKNAKDLLKTLAEEMPELIAAGGSTTVGAPGNGKSGKVLTEADVEKMTPAEINANWEKIQGIMPGQSRQA